MKQMKLWLHDPFLTKPFPRLCPQPRIYKCCDFSDGGLGGSGGGGAQNYINFKVQKT